MEKQLQKIKEERIFQNISCLRLIKKEDRSFGGRKISKHFMFTVNNELRTYQVTRKDFKTFHVYG